MARPEFQEFERLRRRVIAAVIALVAVMSIGVAGYSYIARGTHSIVDAIYMTVITLTTVGFGEVIDMSGNPGARVFTIGLLLVGMGIVAYTVPMLVAMTMEGQLHHIFARRRMASRIEAMNGHFIVCGEAAAAAYVTDELSRSGRGVVVVAPTEGSLSELAERFPSVPGLVGDPSDDDVLVSAGIHRARGVVSCMEGDKDNILVVLTARRLAPGVRIVAATERLESEAKLKVAGADAVVSPSRIGGLRIASELVRPTVVRFLDEMLRDKQVDLRIEEIAVPAGIPPSGTLIGSLWAREIPGVVLLAVRRADNGEFVFRPATSSQLQPGMTLVVMADRTGRERLEARMKELAS